VSYQPPFTITTDILNLVADISQQVGRLDASALNSSPQLRKQNRIKTITGTLAIEGNTLTEEQITAIVEGKPVLGSVRELAEVKGAIAAYDALPTFRPGNLRDLLAAHGLMMSDILVNAGAFRTKAVGIHKGNVVHHVAPPAHQVSGLMAELTQSIAEVAGLKLHRSGPKLHQGKTWKVARKLPERGDLEREFIQDKYTKEWSQSSGI
jgi:Fic family protein